MEEEKLKSKKNFFIIIGILGLIGLITLFLIFFIGDSKMKTQLLSQETLNGLTLPNSIYYPAGTEQQFYYNESSGQFTTMDGLSYQNTSGGYFNVYKNGELIRKFGFGITSDQKNSSTADYTWNWNYDDSSKTWSATNSTPQFYWKINYQFRPNAPMKITHQINNTWKNLTNAKMWYIFTIYDGDILNYDGTYYYWNESVNIIGEEGNGKIIFNSFEDFDFSDTFEDYDVTNFYIGNASMFDYPNIDISALAITKGNGNFNKYDNYTLDPTYSYDNVTTEGTLTDNIRSEPDYSHLSIINESLVLYMPFDVNGSTQYDYSNNDNDGTVTNATWNSTGKYGGAFEFDGSGDYVSVADDSSISPTDEITYCFWYYITDRGGDYGGLGKSDVGASEGWRFWINYDTLGDVYRIGYLTGGWSAVVTDDAPQINAWTHICTTYNNVSWDIYENAVKIHNFSDSGAIGYGNGCDLLVGSVNNNYLKGSIDEVAIWNRSLSAQEVGELYNATYQKFYNSGNQTFELKSVTLGSDDSVNVTIKAEALNDSSLKSRVYEADYDDINNSDMVLYMHMDNLSDYGENDTHVYDFSGMGNNGTVPDGNATWTSSGKLGAGGWSFDGDGDYVNLSNPSSLQLIGNITLCSWTYFNEVPGDSKVMTILGKDDGGWAISYGETGTFNYYLRFVVNGGTWPQTGSTNQATWDNTGDISGSWLHICGVKSGNNGYIYVNGVDRANNNPSMADPMTNPSKNVMIGRRDNADTPNYFNGTMDEVAIWNRSLSAGEIKELYYTGSADHQNGGAGIDWQLTSEEDFSTLNTTHLRATHTIANTSDYLLTEIGFNSENGFYSPYIEDVLVETFDSGAVSSIGLEVITPSNFNGTNVTQNSFFNVTVNISCNGASDCGEINVSLDPEQKAEHTSTTDTICSNGKCTKTLYSGIRNVYEDGQWKKIEDARSLKDSGIVCVVEKEFVTDPTIECVDWNYTSITIKSEDKNSYYVRIKDSKNNEKKNYGEKNLEKETEIPIDLGEILHIGESSTTITLQDNSTEVFDDTYLLSGQPDAVAGNMAYFFIEYQNFPLYTIIKFNLSVPSSKFIENATLYLYTYDHNDLDLSEELNLTSHHFINQSWRESAITYNAFDHSQYNITSTDTLTFTSFTNEWLLFNVTDIVRNEYAMGGENVSILINSTFTDNCEGAEGLYIASRQYPTNVSMKPMLEITYTDEAKSGLISTVVGTTPFYTNESNPRNISLSGYTSQLVTFWVNATGEQNDYVNHTFYVYANSTTNMSINNISSEWNVSIISAVLDDEYPVFSNYQDNNGTLGGSGIGLFNVTLLSTNGTVFLEINNTNITATNLTATIYNVTYSFTASGDYTYRWHSWGNGTSHNYNKSNDRTYTVNATPDSEYPIFTSLVNDTANNTEYVESFGWGFNATITSTNGSVGLEFNGINYTASNISASVFNVTISDLGVGTFDYYWWAYGNGTSHNYNTSATNSYTIAKNGSLTLGLTGTTPVEYPITTDFTESGCPSQLSCSLNISNDIYGVGDISANYSTDGNENYTDTSVVFTITIDQNTTLELGISVTSPITYPTTTDFSGSGCPTELSCALNLSNAVYGVGDISANYSTDGNENYTDASAVDTVTISQNTSATIYTYINNSRANLTIDNNTAIWLNASLFNVSANVKLYNNGTLINDGTSPAGNLTGYNTTGIYNITGIYEGNTNYSRANETWWLNVTPVIGDITPPYFTETPNGQSLSYPNRVAGVNFTGDDETSFGTYAVNDTRFQINSSGWFNDTGLLGVGTYYINITINDSSNNVNSTIYNVNITQNTTLELGISGTDNIEYPKETDVAGSGCPSQLSCSLNIANASYGVADSPVAFNYSTAGNENYTDASANLSITIVQNSSLVLTQTYTSPMTYPTETDFAGAGCPTELSCALNLSNAVYGVGTIYSNYSTDGNENYTASSNLSAIVISQNTSATIYTYINNSRANLTIDNNTAIWLNASLFNLSSVINLYNNGTFIGNASDGIGNLTGYNTTGIYNITGIYEGNTNYSGSSETWWLNVTHVIGDTTNPLITIVTPTPFQVFGSETYYINISSNENLSTCLVNITCLICEDSEFNLEAYATKVNETFFTYYNSTTANEGFFELNITCNDTSNNINNSENLVFGTDLYPPYFSTIPDGTTLEYNQEALEVIFTGTDTFTFDNYTVNDTGNFQINGTGGLINLTNLSIGVYYLNITINDSFNRVNSTIYNVNVSDTTAPIFDNIYNVSIERNQSVNEDFNASDSGVGFGTWAVNNTGDFSIDSTGQLTNITGLQNITYYLNITINDTENNINSIVIYVNVSEPASVDTTPPYFTDIPSASTLEYVNDALSVDFDADDETSFGTYAVNDTDFTIDSVGGLENNTALSVGTYYVNITINDSSNNINSTIYTVTVQDTIAPTFDNLQNHSQTANQSFTFDLDATDHSTLGTFALNETSNYTINSGTGVITNTTGLEYAQFEWFNVSLNDTYGNLVSGIFYINITAISGAVVTTLNADDMILGYNYDLSELNRGDMLFNYGWEW